MGTKDVRITLSDEEHRDLKAKTAPATWKDALRAGVEEVGE